MVISSGFEFLTFGGVFLGTGARGRVRFGFALASTSFLYGETIFLLLSCCGDTQIGSNVVSVNCSANQIIDQCIVSPLHLSSSDDLACFGAY